MKGLVSFCLTVIISLFCSCNKIETAHEILQKTINAIDTIQTIYYKQDMSRTDPQSLKDTIERFREMYFKRLREDSIVGVKGHWFMYVDDRIDVIYEDIYDGTRLIRKNNRDSIVRVYDLLKYPEFKSQPFWGHNTPQGMRHEFKYMLDHTDSYSIARLKDTIITGDPCYQISVKLENKSSMPGFAARLQEHKGIISETLYAIDKRNYYPARMKGVSYMADQPGQKVFIDQRYYDISFNMDLDDKEFFDTSTESLHGFEIIEIQPQ